MVIVTFIDGSIKRFNEADNYETPGLYYLIKWRGGNAVINKNEVRMIEVMAPLCNNFATWHDGDFYACADHVNVLGCAEKYEGDLLCMCIK